MSLVDQLLAGEDIRDVVMEKDNMLYECPRCGHMIFDKKIMKDAEAEDECPSCGFKLQLEGIETEAEVDIDYDGDKASTKKFEKKYNIKIRITGLGSADVTGKKKDIKRFLSDMDYDIDKGLLKELGLESFRSDKTSAHTKAMLAAAAIDEDAVKAFSIGEQMAFDEYYKKMKSANPKLTEDSARKMYDAMLKLTKKKKAEGVSEANVLKNLIGVYSKAYKALELLANEITRAEEDTDIDNDKATYHKLIDVKEKVVDIIEDLDDVEDDIRGALK